MVCTVSRQHDRSVGSLMFFMLIVRFWSLIWPLCDSLEHRKPNPEAIPIQTFIWGNSHLPKLKQISPPTPTGQAWALSMASYDASYCPTVHPHFQYSPWLKAVLYPFSRVNKVPSSDRLFRVFPKVGKFPAFLQNAPVSYYKISHFCSKCSSLNQTFTPHQFHTVSFKKKTYTFAFVENSHLYLL